MESLKIPQFRLSDIFWRLMFSKSDELQAERAELVQYLRKLEAGRIEADYNTGSISLATAWTLYCLTKYFLPERVAEIGTFIGKSTISMALGLDHSNVTNRTIYTCDASNHIELQWAGGTRIQQFKRCSSTQMLEQLQEIDFLFVDGRLAQEDCSLLAGRSPENMVVALDDFEGIEKGVANVQRVRDAGLFKQHLLIYPPEVSLLESLGFTSRASIAVLLPVKKIQLVSQA